ncbi:MAG: hypothetical protein R2789_07860 [Microthrixaceae bacterium]
MPARSVVIEQLTKYTGDGHAMLTPSQFTQLTGRAGRRGIDTRGAAVILWSPYVDFEAVSTLAASREFPLRSSFRPNYNMVVNLVANHPEDQVRSVLGRSFAQFQADRSLVDTRSRLKRLSDDIGEAEAELLELVDPGQAEVHVGIGRRCDGWNPGPRPPMVRWRRRSQGCPRAICCSSRDPVPSAWRWWWRPQSDPVAPA